MCTCSMIVIIIILIIYIVLVNIDNKTYYKSSSFWDQQPICLYPSKKNKLIRPDMPTINEFVNLHDTQFQTWSKVHQETLEIVTNFICDHFMVYGDNKYAPTPTNISPYFRPDDFISIYYSTGTNVPIGIITSRKATAYIKNKKIDMWYVDYLCVHSGYRRIGIAPKLIQTHEYLQCCNIGKSVVSLFKREDESNKGLPLCVYTAHFCDLGKFVRIKNTNNTNNYFTCRILSPNEAILALTMDTFKPWEVDIRLPLDTIRTLIKTNNLIIGGMERETQMVAFFVFRKTCTYIAKNEEIITCIASSRVLSLDDETFYRGFCSIVYKIDKCPKYKYTMLGVEEIGDNCTIMQNISYSFMELTCPMSYYVYNLTHKIYDSKNMFIIL